MEAELKNIESKKPFAHLKKAVANQSADDMQDYFLKVLGIRDAAKSLGQKFPFDENVEEIIQVLLNEQRLNVVSQYL